MLRGMVTDGRRLLILSAIFAAVFATFALVRSTLGVAGHLRRGELVSSLPGFVITLFFFVVLVGSLVMVGSFVVYGAASDPSVEALDRYGPPLQVLSAIDRELAEAEHVGRIGPPARLTRRFRPVLDIWLPGHLLLTPAWLVYLRPDANTFQCMRLSAVSAVRCEAMSDEEGEAPELAVPGEPHSVLIADRFGEQIMLPVEQGEFAERVATEIRLRASAAAEAEPGAAPDPAT